MENSKYHTSVLFFKKAALTWNLLFCFFNSHAQTFSLRASLPISSQYQMVRVTDYGYLVVGEGQDTLPNFHLPMYILGYDYYGELLFQKEYFSNNDLTNPLLDTDINLNDSIVTFATSFLEQENDTLYARLHWVNPTGDTLFTSNYKSPYYYSSNDPQNISYWMLPTSITKSDDNLYIYLVCQIADYPPIQNSFILLKLTAEGEVVWTYHQPFNDNYYACDAVCFHNGNPWLGAAGWGGGGELQ